MVDATIGQRRSTRQKRESIKPVSQTGSDSDSASEKASESEAETPQSSKKRSKTRGPAAKTAKRAKRSKKSTLTVEIDQDAEDDPDRVENFLYEAIMDAEASIDNLVNDFLDSYAEDANESLKDLMNCVLRCCGTKQEITAFDVEDLDSIPETLTQLQDHLTGKNKDVVKTTSDTYPWVSKDKSFKVFHNQMPEFWRNLVSKSADKQYLNSQEPSALWDTTEAWLVSMSSSTLRSFRHTSTVICLEIMGALVELSATTLHDLEVAQKQLKAEQKRSKKGSAKLKTIEKTIEQKTELNDHLAAITSNYFDSVYVHRYRDIDTRIRSDCIRELGGWMLRLPSVFFQGEYFRYFGWLLSDTNGSTRLAVLKGLTRLYGFDEYASNLRHFTARFKDRILDIAKEDAETSIRCAALGVLDKIRERGFLENEDVLSVIGCVYDPEARVRAAVKATFHSILSDNENEIIDEQLAGEVEDHGDLKSSWTNLKALVATMSTLSKTLDALNKADSQKIHLRAEQDAFFPGRTRIAAESFLPGLNNIDFDDIVDYLLYDNDATIEPASANPEDVLKSVLSLSTREEAMLLEIAVAAAELAKEQDARKLSKKDDDSLAISISIMNRLPQLIARFKDSAQLTIVLQLVNVCDLSVYSRMRKTAQFEELLESLTSIYFGYGENQLLRLVGSCLLLFSQETTLQTFVKDKFLDLQDSVRSAVLETTDDLELVQGLMRLSILSSIDDCVLSFEDERADGSSVYSKIKETLQSTDPDVLRYSRLAIRNYLMWKLKQALDSRSVISTAEIDALLERRDDIFFILDAQVESGDQEAALVAAELESPFTSLYEIESFDGLAVRRPLDVNLQQLIMTALQKEMKRYAKLNRSTLRNIDNVSSDEESDNDDDEDADEEAKESRDMVKKLQSERKICTVAGEVVAAMAAKKMDDKYLDVLVSNKGRLGHSFDAILAQIPADMMNAVKQQAARNKTKTRPTNPRATSLAPSEDVIMADVNDDIED